MKQLTDSELKEFAVSLLDKQGLEQYEQFILEHEQKTKRDYEANGFHDIPAECENDECKDCMLDEFAMRELNCPYVEDAWI